MKKSLYFAFISLLLLITFTLQAQQPKHTWKPLGPFKIHKLTGETGAPGLGVMRSIDVSNKNPNHILMGGMSSGIWLSENKGVTWKNVTLNLPVENVKRIAIAQSNNRIVYASTTVGVIKSIDGGIHWGFTSLNLLKKLPCHDREKWNDDRSLLSISPTNAEEVVASTSDTLYKTIDGGKYWKAVLNDFQTQFIQYHPKDGKIVYVGGAYKKNPGQFFILRSIDGGITFKEVTKGLPDKMKLVRLYDITAAVTTASPDKLYLIIFGEAKVKTTVKHEEKNQMVGAFMVSDDKGESFHNVPQVNNYRYIDDHYSLYYNYSSDEDKEKYDFDYKDSSFWQASFQQVGWATSIAISDKDPNTMIMAASAAVFSKDGGRKWNYIRKQRTYAMHGDIQQVKIVGNDIWLVNDGGLYYVNFKDRIPKRIEGFSGQDLWGFSTSFKTDIMAVGVDHSGTMVYDKKIYGDEWYHYGGGDAMTATINPLDDRYLYASPGEHEIIKLPTTLRDEPISRPSPIAFGYIPNRNLEFNPNMIYTIFGISENSLHWNVKTCSIIKTTDNFKTIDTLKTFPDKQYLKRIRVSIADTNYIYAICNKPSEIWMSMDAGKTWNNITPQNDSAKKFGFTDVAISDKDPKHLFVSVGGFQNFVKILFSDNAGKTWADYHSNELPRNALLTMAFQRGTNEGIYLGCEPGVFYRNNTMDHWAEMGKGLPYSPVNFIYLNYDKSKIRIGTYRGIWECDLFEDFEPRAIISMNKNVLPSGDNADARKIFFYDNSAIKGKAAKWFWEFPGSIQQTSTEENPIIDYEAAKPGKYSIRLSIADSKGRKSSYELKDFIEVKNNAPWNLREIKLETQWDAENEKD